jgi:hypothetical protein
MIITFFNISKSEIDYQEQYTEASLNFSPKYSAPSEILCC